LDHLKEGVGLRGYAQKDPKNEYKRESYELFQEMKERIEDTILKTLYRLEPVSPEQMEEQRRRRAAMAAKPRFQLGQQPGDLGAGPAPAGPDGAVAGGMPPGPPRPAKPQTVVRDGDKIGRNDPCPCGSGTKYKKCHGKVHAAT
ncbi:MAG: SEC-C metal-binding domain-containing protein, partial [Acidobacteriota bacterium]|nr:SEC-C metal-binding domain-containing protein [Acidobacteriota bacterium]